MSEMPSWASGKERVMAKLVVEIGRRNLDCDTREITPQEVSQELGAYFYVARHTCPSAEKAQEPPLSGDELEALVRDALTVWEVNRVQWLDSKNLLNRRAVREMMGKENPPPEEHAEKEKP
jgi:hypothetical protein